MAEFGETGNDELSSRGAAISGEQPGRLLSSNGDESQANDVGSDQDETEATSNGTENATPTDVPDES